ncbi:unnamed protein product [Dicrocoelium dendriticum]|nr:unnamed protein product [Dicrocoelium dendriticum]
MTTQYQEDDSQNTEETSRNLMDVEAADTPGQHVYQVQLPDLWDMTLDVQASMVEAIVSLTRETAPRWRQVLFGIAGGPDEPATRGVVGVTSNAVSSPGGPPTSGDLMMLRVNPTPTSVGLGQVVSSATGMIQSGSVGGPLTGSTGNLGLPLHTETLSPSPRGVTGVSPTNVNTSTEFGELSLTGRYTTEDHKVLAVYGALLVGEKCRPREVLNVELLTRITAGIVNWFLDTIYTTEAGSVYDGRGTLRQRYELGDLLEKVKSEYILKWIQEVQRLHPEAIFAVLLPHPLEYARVGSCWDTLCNRTTQVKQGLSRLGSLIPYDIITFEVWDFVMPYWLESIRTEVPRAEYFELEVLLKKIFDATAGPFPFLPQKVYHFAAESFINTPAAVQDQALAWLEILTTVEVPIPMKELLTMFRNGVESFQTEILMPDICNYNGDQDPHDEVNQSQSKQNGTQQHPLTADHSVRQHTHEADNNNNHGQSNNHPTDSFLHDGNILQRRRLTSPPQSDEDQTQDEAKNLLSGTATLPKKLTKRSRKLALQKHASDGAEIPEASPIPEHLSGCPIERNAIQDNPRSQPPQPSATIRSERSKGTATEYRATACLTQMLNVAYRQLKIQDPLGHTKLTQETPQLLFGLLGEMLQVYWGYSDTVPQRGLKTMYCEGLESCIFPPIKEATFLRSAEEEETSSRSECIHCLDILSLLNYTNLICQHLVPVRPSPKSSVDCTPEALTQTAELSEQKDWRSSSVEGSGKKKLAKEFTVSCDLPDTSYVNMMPPLIRFVYLLLQFIRRPPGVSSNEYELESNSSVLEPQCTQDPIALQCVIECLVYLCHLGKVLQNSIANAKKNMMSPTVGSTLLGSGEQQQASGVRGHFPGKAPTQIAAGSQMSSGAGLKDCAATPQAQLNFIFYLIHCHLIPSLWSMLKSDLSQVSSWVVPLLLHCVTLPGGSTVLWRIIEDEFAHIDWRIRFDAIEKAAVMLRELDHQVLNQGFSNAAGVKIASLLSGGITVNASGVHLFTRSVSAAGARSRTTGGRMNTTKGFVALNRAHGGGVMSTEGMIDSTTSPNENPFIRTAVAHALCRLIESLDDHNPIIAQSAAKHLASLNNMALTCGVQCLEFQFDTVVADRCLILQRMHQLSCALPNRQVFTWDFFVNRFGLLALHAQLNLSGKQEIDAVMDINGYHRNSQHFQTQFDRACFALSASSALRAISKPNGFGNSRFKMVANIAEPPAQLSHPNAVRHAHSELPTFVHEPTTAVKSQDISTGLQGQQSVKVLDNLRSHTYRRSRMSISPLVGFFPNMHSGVEFMDTSSKVLSNIRSALEQNGSERDTLHQWVRLLLEFMATVPYDHRLDDCIGVGTAASDVGASSAGSGFTEAVSGTEGTGGGRHQANATSKEEMRDRRALYRAEQHIAFLLGYVDGAFSIPPHKMRASTAFHSFLAHVSGVLDRNFSMGSNILHQTLAVLQFCASPQRYATDTQPPTFTLRLLEPQLRMYWLRTLAVILYKYEYSDFGGAATGGFTGTAGMGTSHLTTSLNHTGLTGGASTTDCTSGPPRLRKTSSEANLLDQGQASRSVCDGGHAVLGINLSSGHGDATTNVPTLSGGSASPPRSGHYMAGTAALTNLPSGGTRGLIEYLIRIVLNTLDAHVHVCRDRKEDEPYEQPTSPLRLRGVSTVSGDFNTIVEKDTPPASPGKVSQEADEEIVMPGVTVTPVDSGERPIQEEGRRQIEVGEDEPSDYRLQCFTDSADPESTQEVPSGLKSLKVASQHQTLMAPSSQNTKYRAGWKTVSSAIPDANWNEGAKGIGKQAYGINPTPSTEISDLMPQSIPSTLSVYEQTILAPVLNDGAEIHAVHNGSITEATSSLQTGGVVGSRALAQSKVGRKGALRFQKHHPIDIQYEEDADSENTEGIIANQLLCSVDPTHISAISDSTDKEHHQLETDEPDFPAEFQDSVGKQMRSSKALKIVANSDLITRTSNLCRTERKKLKPSKDCATLQPTSQSSSATVAAATVALNTERCAWCNQLLERYDESTLGLGIICLATFVHQEPALAAPFLREMMLIMTRLANTPLYSWQSTAPHVIVPGNVSSIARQFLRCTMYNLAPNGLFLQLFQTAIPDEHFFRCIISVLVDFEEHMSFFEPILLVLEPLNKRKSLPTDSLPTLLENLANYLEHLPNLTDDTKINHFIATGWSEIIGPLELFLRKLVCVNPVPANLDTSVRIMTYILRSPVASNFKTLPDTFAALLRIIVGNVTFRLCGVIELCSLSNRTLKERTKSQLSKAMVELFLQYIKFRISLPDENLMKLLQFILLDAGGTAEPNQVVDGLTSLFNPQTYHLFATGASELMRPHLTDCITFISDVHTINKVKQAQKSAAQLKVNSFGTSAGSGPTAVSVSANPKLSANLSPSAVPHNTAGGLLSSGLSTSAHGGLNVGSQTGGLSTAIGLATTLPSIHEDVLGAHLKSGVAQYVALELSRSSNCNDQDVLSILAPGLIADIRPMKSAGFVTSHASNRVRTTTTCAGPSAPTVGMLTSHQGTETDPAKNTRLSGSITSKKSEDSDRRDKTAHRNTDTTVIVITPSVDPPESPSGNTEADAKRSLRGSFSVSANSITTPSSLSPRGNTSNSSIVYPQSTGYGGTTLSMTENLTLPPGSPSTISPKMGAYNHMTPATTLSQTSQLDAPVLHILPWLKSIPPSSQLGPRDFLVMVERARTISWLLLGATMNMALTREATGLACRPIPFVLVRAVADLVKALLSSFPEQQKQSVTVMSSLYHVFLLCQLWTVYCEAAASLAPLHSTQHKVAIATAMDFWTRVMPTVLRLLSISEDFIVVSGRLLSVIEELLECQCSTVTKFIPIWIPMLCGRQRQLPGNMLKRLQKIIEWAAPEPCTRMLLLLSISEANDQPPRNTMSSEHPESEPEKLEKIRLHTTTPSLPGLSTSSLTMCQANALMGCNPIPKVARGLAEEEGASGAIQCAGHALASNAPYGNVGIGTGVGIGAGALGTDLLTSRLVAWLKKHIFVLGRNEDQHSTATHIFVH